ncbi:MAG: aminoglycoside phosphotransferase family protein [Deltaproteobacteria bacterium]|nr:aminoglycoside phosphotransferase family protein [Deltaproteobacteria bacterium]
MNAFDFPEILNHWNLSFRHSAGNDEIQGSPERTVHRVVVYDNADCKWILEQIAEEQFTLKSRIAETLERLQKHNLSLVHPYLRNRSGKHITCHAGELWTLRPFIDGVHLNRKEYLADTWRANAMAEFLARMRNVSDGITGLNNGPVFSIMDYARERMAVYQKHRPALFQGLEPVFQSLEKSLAPVHDNIRTAFCHGDYHPVNIIWGEDCINSVIDWEFCGRKPETYDAALLLGCLGFDDPDALIGPLVLRFARLMRESGIYADASWESIFDLVIAIRFGWLSEWLRWTDRSARKLEVLYMNLLTTQKDYILDRWRIFQ